MRSLHSTTEHCVFPATTNSRIRLELNANTLAKLMENGYIHAADFRCLDSDSKQCVQKLCLINCANCLFQQQKVN